MLDSTSTPCAPRALPLKRPVRLAHAAAAALLALSFAGCGGGGDAAPAAPVATHWVGTWAAAPTGPADAASAAPLLPYVTFNNQTIRMVVRSSVAGSSVRIRLSNEIGNAPGAVTVGAAHVALRDVDGSIIAGSDRVLKFGGQTSVTIAPKTPVLSDPVALDVPALADLAVSVYLPTSTVTQSFHSTTRQAQYVIAGDATATVSIPATASSPVPYWFLLSGVEVTAPTHTAALVALGDSITDGYGLAAPKRVNAPTPWPSWPSRLAERLQGDASSKDLAVLNEGISGNRLLHDAAGDISSVATFGPSALSRFDRDVLGQAGVSCMILFEGINDIGQGTANSQVVSSDDVIAGQRQLIARAKASGLAAIGATLTPFSGYAGLAGTYYTAQNETARQAVNTWIRTSGEFDAVVDFDATVRDPAAPVQLLSTFDSGDHLHPSDAGYNAMANAVDLPTLKRLCLH